MYVTVSGKGRARVIQLRKDTRIPGTNKKKIEVIKTLGNYEKMLAEDPLIMQKLRAEAKEISLHEKEKDAPVSLRLRNHELTTSSEAFPLYPIGHAPLLALWKKMGLDRFFKRNVAPDVSANWGDRIFRTIVNQLVSPETHYAGLVDAAETVRSQDLLQVAHLKDRLLSHLRKFFSSDLPHRSRHAYYYLIACDNPTGHSALDFVLGLLAGEQNLPLDFTIFEASGLSFEALTDASQALKRRFMLDSVTLVMDRSLEGMGDLTYLLHAEQEFVFVSLASRMREDVQSLALAQEDWVNRRDQDAKTLLWKEKKRTCHLSVKGLLQAEERALLPKRRGRPQKYQTVLRPLSLHFVWSQTLAARGAAERKLLETRFKRMIAAAPDHDTAKALEGTYAIVSNKMESATSELFELCEKLWQLEAYFQALEYTEEESDERLRNGIVTLRYLGLSMITYAQERLRRMGQDCAREELRESLRGPAAVVIGEYPAVQILPLNLSQTYLDLAEALEMPKLRSCLSLNDFQKITGLAIGENLRQTMDSKP